MLELTTATRFRGELSYAQSLATANTWRVGGVADCCFTPADRDDLQAFLHQLPDDEPLTWLGLGSNSLIRDGGIRGTVILYQPGLHQLEFLNDTQVRAEVGVACAAFARQTVRRGLLGMEFLAGIPGAIGGALAMNAGCHGGETWNFVDRVETIDHAGVVRERSPEDFTVAYRQVDRPVNEWFLSADFSLQSGMPAEGQARIKALLSHRAATQPVHLRNSGSVFRNPPGDFAGRLIESSGLKGYQIGGAMVSEKHANFITNEGEATAADIEALITHVQQQVARVHGVMLQPEVKIMGEPV